MKIRVSGRSAVVAAAMLAGACGGYEANDGARETAAGGRVPRAAIEAGDIARNPAAYLGQRVTVRAEVEEVLHPQVFTLDEDETYAGPDVLVVAPDAATAARDDANVTVTGVVRAFDVVALERDFDFFDPGPEWEARYGSRPVIVADSVMAEAAGSVGR